MFFFLHFSVSSYFTIDFGSFYTKSAIENENRIPEITTNLYSKRLTPSFVAFKAPKDFNMRSKDLLDEEEIKKLVPVIGERAVSVLNSHPWSGSGYLSHYIDVDINESRNISQKLYNTSPNDTRFKLFNLTSTFLHFYSEMVLGCDHIDDVATTLVVPGTFSQPQINWLTDAAQHAKLKNITTIFDWEAVANLFVQRRPDIIQQEGRTVLFIDAGATSTKAYTIKFEHRQGLPRYAAKLKSYHVDYEAGGAFITSKFAELLKRRINSSRPLLPYEESSIIAAAEAGKKKLSLLPKINITIEDICGRDYNFEVTRNEFNKAAAEQVDLMISTVKHEIKKVIPDYVEVIGGSSRVSLFKQKLIEVIAPKKYGTSLNADEALAMGGEYYAIEHLVGGEMNTSFYGVSFCQGKYCHDLMIGNANNLGFTGNPAVVYFNITTPLRRGLETYQWGYHPKEAIKDFTNYFFFKRGPIQLEKCQQCLDSVCKDQVVILLKLDYGKFVSILDVESKARYNLQFKTNELEEKFNYLNQQNRSIRSLSIEDQNKINTFKSQLKEYLWDQQHTLGKTTKFTKEFEKINELVKGQLGLEAEIERAKEEIKRAKHLVDYVYPTAKKWIREDVYEALCDKIKETEGYVENAEKGFITESVMREKAATLEVWCDSLPEIPAIKEKGKLKTFLFYIGNKFIDFLEKLITSGDDTNEL